MDYTDSQLASNQLEKMKVNGNFLEFGDLCAKSFHVDAASLKAIRIELQPVVINEWVARVAAFTSIRLFHANRWIRDN